MIVNVCDCTSDRTLMVYTNGGSNNLSHISPLKFLPIEVHFNPYSMTNILEIKDVASIIGVQISMDSSKDHTIIGKYKNLIIKFQ